MTIYVVVEYDHGGETHYLFREKENAIKKAKELFKESFEEDFSPIEQGFPNMEAYADYVIRENCGDDFVQINTTQTED